MDKQIKTEEIIQYNKIGGWLIVVIIGLILYIINVARVEYTMLSTILGNSFDKNMLPAIIFEAVTNLLLLIYACYIMIILFQKKRSVPKLIIAFYVLIYISLIIDGILVFNLRNYSPNYTLYVVNFFKSYIWITYFIVSKRVKGTFVK